MRVAYRKAPSVEVRILCRDAPGSGSLVAMDIFGGVTKHYPDGRYVRDEKSSRVRKVSSLDLVPLEDDV
jgi:hypothetical protein